MRRRQLVFLAFSPLLRAEASVVGRWRSMTTTRGGIGAVYEFLPNGRVTYSSATLVDTDFRQDGNQLTLAGQQIGFGWHPDGRLQLNFGNGLLEDYTRRGKTIDQGNPLLGEFRGRRLMGELTVPVTLQFRESNRATVVVFLKTVIGRYQGVEGAWAMTIPSMPARRVSHDQASGYLTITAVGGDPHSFTPF
jgi:hypothetical protein